jgi:hypothetical protein
MQLMAPAAGSVMPDRVLESQRGQRAARLTIATLQHAAESNWIPSVIKSRGPLTVKGDTVWSISGMGQLQFEQ